jgi:hypothetical protein
VDVYGSDDISCIAGKICIIFGNNNQFLQIDFATLRENKERQLEEKQRVNLLDDPVLDPSDVGINLDLNPADENE